MTIRCAGRLSATTHRAVRADAEAIMPPAFVDCLRKIERPFFTPIYDFSASKIVFGRSRWS